jgi:hypothetical protein
MEFSNLTNDQIAWLEGKIKEAYDEGIYDSEISSYGEPVGDWDGSLAKNSTCHILAERFMVGVGDGDEKMDIIN